MWETPFDPSMLTSGKTVLIYPAYNVLRHDLMLLLEQYNIKWASGIRPVEFEGPVGYENIVYSIDCSSRPAYMQYGKKEYYDSEGKYDSAIKCTFYGTNMEDFEIATDEEIRSLFE